MLLSVSRKFREEEETTSRELFLEPEEYRIEVDVSGAGRLEVPGFRLDNGILILYITPNYVFQFPQGSITIYGSEDFVQITLTPTKFGFKGKVSLNLEDAEEVEVILKGNIKEPILLISHESLISPKELANALGKISLISGHGEFELEAKLKYPLKKT